MKAKKILALLLSLAMILCTLNVSVFAEDATVTSVSSYSELVSALANGGNIALTSDITVETGFTAAKSATVDLGGNTLYVKVGGVNFNSPEGITLKNGTIDITGAVASGDAIFGIGLRIDSTDENDKCNFALDDVNVIGDGYSSAYGVFYIYYGNMTVNNCYFNLANDQFEAGGVFKSDNANSTLKITGSEMKLYNVRRVVTHTTTTVEDSSIAITGDDETSAEMEHGFNRCALTVKNSDISMKNLSGRGITAENGAVTIDSTSTVSMINCEEATIDVRGNQTVTVAEGATVTLDAEPTVTSGSVSGEVTIATGEAHAAYFGYELDDGVDEYYLAIDIADATGVKELAVEVRDADGNVLTTVTPEGYQIPEDGVISGYLTARAMITGDSSSWQNTAWDIAGCAPAVSVALIINGVEIDTAPISYALDGEKYDPDTDWTELVRAVYPLPTATVTDISAEELAEENAPALTFAKKFVADEPSEAVAEYYSDWYADFVLTLNKTVTFNANGNVDGYLAGEYGEYGWIQVPFEDVKLEAGTSLKIMEYAAELMGQPGLKITYNDVLTAVKEFDCGIFLNADFLAANPDLEVTLELRIYNPADGTESYSIGDNYDFTAPKVVAKVGNVGYSDLQSAVNAAADGGTVVVIGDASDETVTVGKNLTITCDESDKKTLNNVNITVTEQVGLTVSNLKFTGDSYINASNATALTVTGCEADVTPTKITGRAAFIVLGTGEPTYGLLLNVSNNNIVASKGDNTSGDPYAAAVFGWRYLADGSTISNNTLGSSDKPFTFIAVKTMNAMDGATITIESNTVYGTNASWNFKAFDLYQNCSRDNKYTVISKNNTIYATDASDEYTIVAFYVECNGDGNALVYDNGTTLNGNAITLDDFGFTDGAYINAGVNVVLDGNGKIIGGTFKNTVADEYLAEGYVSTENTDGTYGVEEEEEVITLDTKFLIARDYVPNNYGGWDEPPYGILFAVGIDSLHYAAGGFEITINGTTKTFYIDNTVYKTLTINGTTYTPDILADGANYFMYYTVTFSDAMVEANPELTVRAFLKTSDGEIIYSGEKTVTVK